MAQIRRRLRWPNSNELVGTGDGDVLTWRVATQDWGGEPLAASFTAFDFVLESRAELLAVPGVGAGPVFTLPSGSYAIKSGFALNAGESLAGSGVGTQVLLMGMGLGKVLAGNSAAPLLDVAPGETFTLIALSLTQSGAGLCVNCAGSVDSRACRYFAGVAAALAVTGVSARWRGSQDTYQQPVAIAQDGGDSKFVACTIPGGIALSGVATQTARLTDCVLTTAGLGTVSMNAALGELSLSGCDISETGATAIIHQAGRLRAANCSISADTTTILQSGGVGSYVNCRVDANGVGVQLTAGTLRVNVSEVLAADQPLLQSGGLARINTSGLTSGADACVTISAGDLMVSDGLLQGATNGIECTATANVRLTACDLLGTDTNGVLMDSAATGRFKASDSTIQGGAFSFRQQGGTADLSGCLLLAPATVLRWDLVAVGARISHCTLDATTGGGNCVSFQSTSLAQGVLIEGCTFAGLDTAAVEGVDSPTGSVRIADCTIPATFGTGITWPTVNLPADGLIECGNHIDSAAPFAGHLSTDALCMRRQNRGAAAYLTETVIV